MPTDESNLTANTGPEDWNRRYQAGEFQHRQPDPFVMTAHAEYLQPLLSPGSNGLDLAGGAGHHAIWLVQQGWQMALSDWSDAALNLARERTADLSITIIQGAALDVTMQFLAESRRFAFILVSFFLDRDVLPILPKLLVPGGLLLYRTYTTDNERLGNPRGPRNPAHLVASQELLKVFHEMRILHYRETVVAKGIVELVAQRIWS